MRTPTTFALCVAGDCPRAAHCLRRQALLQMDGARRDVIMTINPVGLAIGYDCPHYKSAERIRMAAGFSSALCALPHGCVNAVKGEITKRFCLRNYYHLRRGDRPMTPTEQAFVADILERHGAPSPVRFDRYYDDYDWD